MGNFSGLSCIPNSVERPCGSIKDFVQLDPTEGDFSCDDWICRSHRRSRLVRKNCYQATAYPVNTAQIASYFWEPCVVPQPLIRDIIHRRESQSFRAKEENHVRMMTDDFQNRALVISFAAYTQRRLKSPTIVLFNWLGTSIARLDRIC